MYRSRYRTARYKRPPPTPTHTHAHTHAHVHAHAHAHTHAHTLTHTRKHTHMHTHTHTHTHSPLILLFKACALLRVGSECRGDTSLLSPSPLATAAGRGFKGRHKNHLGTCTSIYIHVACYEHHRNTHLHLSGLSSPPLVTGTTPLGSPPMYRRIQYQTHKR